MKTLTKVRRALSDAAGGSTVVTRRDVVDRVNQLIVHRNQMRPGPYLAPLLRYGAWQRAVSVARQRRLFPADVLTAVANHGFHTTEVSQ